MHPNPIFRRTEIRKSLAFARARAFGTLLANGDATPRVAHVPFLLSEDGQTADLHLLRSNPLARAAPTMAKLSILGPDSYISPDWYEAADQVPTWNYIAVHLTGTLELLPQDDLHALLDRQSAHFETQLKPKTPWTTAKMTPDVLEKMMRVIQPARLTISDVDSTWKLNQNKPDAVRQRAAQEVAQNGIGTSLDALAAHMRAP